jgi:two-component system, LytTR family, response regulator
MEIHIGSRKIVNSNNILRLKSDLNYTKVYFYDGTSILVSTTMGIIASRLPKEVFIRINRQEIINISSISKYEIDKKIDSVFLKNNQVIYVSRRRRLDLRQILSNNINQ